MVKITEISSSAEFAELQQKSRVVVADCEFCTPHPHHGSGAWIVGQSYSSGALRLEATRNPLLQGRDTMTRLSMRSLDPLLTTVFPQSTPTGAGPARPSPPSTSSAPTPSPSPTR